MTVLDWLASYRKGNRLLHGLLFGLTAAWLLAWLLYLLFVTVVFLVMLLPNGGLTLGVTYELVFPMLGWFPLGVLTWYSQKFCRGRNIASGLRMLWVGLAFGTVLASVIARFTQPLIFFIVMLPAIPGVHLIHIARGSKDKP
ncbi:MAG: hypothetical protein R3270_12070 [Gammaproteobacteria bacterium]|nr:hypothetical protein [Gammaproteobacteria bacterium]